MKNIFIEEVQSSEQVQKFLFDVNIFIFKYRRL